MEIKAALPAVAPAVAPLHSKQDEVRTDPAAKPARERLLRLPEVESRCGLKKSALYALMGKQQFPACVLIGSRSVAWKESSIDAWIQSRLEQPFKPKAQP